MERKAKSKGGSFVRKGGGLAGDVLPPGTKLGPHGVAVVSTGLQDLDEIIGGGIPVGGIVMVMEDLDAPHHMLLMRYFMAQGLAHGQPLLFASPLTSPRSFLGTLPGLVVGDERKGLQSEDRSSQGEDLRIAWQYRRFLSEQQALVDRRLQQQQVTQSWNKVVSQLPDQSFPLRAIHEYSCSFDLRKPMERRMWSSENVECFSLLGEAQAVLLQEKIAGFFDSLVRVEAGGPQVGRIVLQSLCAPHCVLSSFDWELLAFLHGLKSRLRQARAVAFISFPSALLKPSICARWQHLSDILLSIEAVRDNDKQMEASFSGYRDMVGLLRVRKLSSMNTQVPATSETSPFAIKVLHKKKVVLERLQEVPIDASAGGSGSVVSLCATPADAPSRLDF